METEVRIVRLDPARVAYATGFGTGPEEEAWNKLMAWAMPAGLQKDPAAHRWFGFNNPDPHPGSPNYGYEQWVTIGPQDQPVGDVQVKDFPGGLYAVTHCKLVNITQTWQELVNWRENSAYLGAHHQWLEECLNPPVNGIDPQVMTFDLYLPIAEMPAGLEK